VPAPDFKSGEVGFQTRLNARVIKFGALALVAASEAVSEFFRSQHRQFSHLLAYRTKDACEQVSPFHSGK